MKVLALIPKTTEIVDEQSVEVPARFIVEATEEELDKVSGISTTAHIEGRIKVGHEIKISPVYDKLDYFVVNKTKLEKAVLTLRDAADGIEDVIPAEE